MRRFLFLLVCLSLILSSGIAVAGTGRFSHEETGFGYVTTDTSVEDEAMLSSPCYITAVTIYASSSNATAVLYDATSYPSTGSARLSAQVVELGEATQYDSVRETFDPPIQCDSGIYVDLTGCVVTVEYR